MSEWKTIWRANLRGLPFMAACVAIGWAIGVTIALLLMAFLFEPGDGHVCFGIFFALLGVLVGGIASRNLHASTRYALAISMGQTRREFLIWNGLLKILESAGAMLLVFLLSQAEDGLYQHLFPGDENVLRFAGEMFLGKWTVWILAGSTVAFAVIDLVMTALMLRFGMKILYVIIICTCFLPGLFSNAISAYETQSNTLMAQLGGLLAGMVQFFTTAAGIGVLIAAVVLVLAAASAYLLRAPVKL